MFLHPTDSVDIPRHELPRMRMLLEPHNAPEPKSRRADRPPSRGGRDAEAVAVVAPDDLHEPRVSRPHRVCRSLAKIVLILITSDAIALVLSAAASLAILHLLHVDRGAHLAWTAVIAVLPLVLAYGLAHLYPGIGVHGAVELRQIVKANSFVFLAAISVAMTKTHAAAAWAAFFAAAWLASNILVPLCRAATRALCSRHTGWGLPALVISSATDAQAIVRMLTQSRSIGLRPVGIVPTDADDAAPPAAAGPSIPVLRRRTEIIDLIEDQGIRYGIIFLPDRPSRVVYRWTETYSHLLSHVLLLSDRADLPWLWNSPRTCGSFSGTEVRNGLMLPAPRAVKRAADVLVSAMALFVLSPVLLVLVGLIKATSRGPVLYGHSRVGRQGDRFKVWKFRSMVVNGDAVLKQHFESSPEAKREWERDCKLRDDPRVTRIGRVMRKLSFDELPQLWNVLVGDMSLVGPRPIPINEVDKYSTFGSVFRLYTDVKPGITGLWQVSGRNNTTYEERVRFDQYYIRNWSPWLDLHILARTVRTIVTGDGAF